MVRKNGVDLSYRNMWFFVVLSMASISYADLPTMPDPEGFDGNGDNNFVAWLQAWIGQIGAMAATVVSTVLFVWAGWICFSKFNEARSSNNPDWGSVGLTAIVAAGLLIVSGYFLTQATEVIGEGGNNALFIIPLDESVAYNVPKEVMWRIGFPIV